MNLPRFLEVVRADLRFHVRRPMFWVMVVILALLAWGLSSGGLRIQSGDSEVGGKKSFITSEFAQAQLSSILVLLVTGFFVAVAFGLAIPRDEEQKIGELLHSTPLTIAEYVWGRFTALLAAFGGLLVFQALANAFFNHVTKTANSSEFIGPFEPGNYLLPIVAFALPAVVFIAGTSFLVGAWSKKPVLVFLLPTLVLLVSIFFVWDFSPSWLSPTWNRVLMLVDPAGYRWLNETWLKVDKGAEFYNTQPVGFDAGFLLSRLAFVALGLASVFVAQLRIASTLRSTRKIAAAERSNVEAPSSDPDLRPFTPELSSPPSLVAGAAHVARAEMRELWSQPGLYIFVPLILLEVMGDFLSRTGAFDTPLLLTPGLAAAGSMNTLTLCVCLLLLFYTTESLVRESSRGLASIYYATPVRSASILFGKSIANCAVAGAILLAAFLGSAIVMLVQGQVSLSVFPFLVTWGLLLVPTFLVWSAFVTLLYAVTRNRYGTYGLALGVLILTGWMQARGKMNWAGNWNLWSSVRWSDFALFELTRRELALNRAAYLSLGVLFLVLAVRFFPRRALDPTGVYERLKPRALGRAALRIAPFAAVPFTLLALLVADVRAGFQGDDARKAAKDYHKKNVETWKDAPRPSITGIDLALELDPPRRYLHSRGTLTLLNDLEKPLTRIPVTIGTHWRSPTWTIDGEVVTPDDRAGLEVFTPKTPLAPGGTLRLGFEFDGFFPDGATENGGNSMEFVLPSGAVLTGFTPTMLPLIGFVPDIGIDDDNRTDPKQWADDFYVGITKSGSGSNTPASTHITVTAPAEYTLNSVGELVSDVVHDGKRTSTWVSDHPVEFVNVVAGKWDVERGDGTAIYFLPKHRYNVDEMLRALDGARHYYSEWFATYPWKELKLSEFAGHAGYAQGFPTDITFSENIGFLTKSDADAEVAFMVTAHESAHQWWGNMLNPGDGPGANILSEGMAHFSTGLLIEAVQGERERIAFFTQIEDRYGKDRQVDSEKPLVKITGDRPGDTTCTYDKGGWVAWMMLQEIGRARMFAGCRDFIARYETNPDHPVIQDFLAVMREHAPDPAAFDAFAAQWCFDVVVPEYRVESATKTKLDDGTWEARCTVRNAGTAYMPVEIAATRGERWAKADRRKSDASDARDASVLAASTDGAAGGPSTAVADDSSAADTASKDEDAYEEARETLVLGAGEAREVVIHCAFEPAKLVVDPDAKVLMLKRKLAQATL